MTVRRRPGCRRRRGRRHRGGQQKIIYIYIYVIYVSNPMTSVANRNKLCFVTYVFVDVRKFYGPKITVCRMCSVPGGSSEENKKIHTWTAHLFSRSANITITMMTTTLFSQCLKRLEPGVGNSNPNPGWFWHVFSVLYSMYVYITRRIEMSNMTALFVTVEQPLTIKTIVQLVIDPFRLVVWNLLVKPWAIGTRVKYDFVVFAWTRLECEVGIFQKNVKQKQTRVITWKIINLWYFRCIRIFADVRRKYSSSHSLELKNFTETDNATNKEKYVKMKPLIIGPKLQIIHVNSRLYLATIRNTQSHFIDSIFWKILMDIFQIKIKKFFLFRN